MNGCCLRLQSEAGLESFGGGQTLKTEFELIEKFIESIIGTGLHTVEGDYELLFVSLTQPNKDISLCDSAFRLIQSTLTKNFTSTHCCRFKARSVVPVPTLCFPSTKARLVRSSREESRAKVKLILALAEIDESFIKSVTCALTKLDSFYWIQQSQTPSLKVEFMMKQI